MQTPEEWITEILTEHPTWKIVLSNRNGYLHVESLRPVVNQVVIDEAEEENE